MTTRSTTHVSLPAPAGAPRTLLLTGLGALAFSLVMLAAMRLSTNPVPGEFAFDFMVWVRDVATGVGAVLVAAAVTLRQLLRP